MCGIIGFTGEEKATPILIDGLSKMEYRGYDSAGIAVLDNGTIAVTKAVGRVATLQERITAKPLAGTCGIGHTRWATHGGVTEKNAHPHLSNDGKFAVCHNGIIENFAELKSELTAKGYHFQSDTDTEVIALLLQDEYAGDFQKALSATVSKIRGSFALVVLCADEPNLIYATKKNAPLIIGIGDGFHLCASDVTALVSHTKKIIYLQDGEYAHITPNSIEVLNPDGNKTTPKIEQISWDIAASEKQGYDHFMLKEIMEQGEAVHKAIYSRLSGDEIVLDGCTLTAKELKNIDRIIITACGSAYYAGCVGKYIIEKFWHKNVQVELASELRYSSVAVNDRTLLIVLSQSGETADTIAAVKELKKHGARVLAIVNVVESTIAKLSDDVLYTCAGPEIAVATTKGYTTQVAVLFTFALWGAKLLRVLPESEYTRLVSELKTLPDLIKKTLDLKPKAENLAKELSKANNVFFLGRNTDWPVALEGALKLKEISYIHAESYASGELKHGTIALIEEGTEVVAICCNDELLEKSWSNVMEVKARGANVHVVAQSGSFSEPCTFEIPAVSDIFSPILAVVPLQLMAYYTAILRGCDVDKPRNLAKSVTVE